MKTYETLSHVDVLAIEEEARALRAEVLRSFFRALTQRLRESFQSGTQRAA